MQVIGPHHPIINFPIRRAHGELQSSNALREIHQLFLPLAQKHKYSSITSAVSASTPSLTSASGSQLLV
jgi:hypothetical protein